MKSPFEISPRTLWAAGGVAFVLVALWSIGTQLIGEAVLLFGAIVVAEGIRPLVMLLERYRVPRPLATFGIILVVIAVLTGLGWIIVAPLVTQIASLVNDVPHFAAQGQQYLAQYQQFLHDNRQARSLLGQLPARISDFLTSQVSVVLQAPLIVFGTLSNVFLILLIVFFWLMASREISTFVLSFVPVTRRLEGRDVLDELSRKVGGYVRGVLINMSVIGVLSGAGVAFLGVPYALLLGVVAALTEAIPIVGPLLGGSAAVAVALLAMGPGKALQVTLLYVVIQQVEGNTLVPLVMNRVVSLNPLTIIVALLIGSALLGIPGAVLAVPAAAILQVLTLRVAAPALRRATRSEG